MCYRNALGRSCYNNRELNIGDDICYLIKFYENILLVKKNVIGYYLQKLSFFVYYHR